jgi:hypothetical protein
LNIRSSWLGINSSGRLSIDSWLGNNLCGNWLSQDLADLDSLNWLGNILDSLYWLLDILDSLDWDLNDFLFRLVNNGFFKSLVFNSFNNFFLRNIFNIFVLINLRNIFSLIFNGIVVSDFFFFRNVFDSSNSFIFNDWFFIRNIFNSAFTSNRFFFSIENLWSSNILSGWGSLLLYNNWLLNNWLLNNNWLLDKWLWYN